MRRVKQEYRAMVDFRRVNLVARLASRLAPGGRLMIEPAIYERGRGVA